MRKQRFNELLQSVKEAAAIQRGELKPSRVFGVKATKRKARTSR
jgi:hypothetical protein